MSLTPRGHSRKTAPWLSAVCVGVIAESGVGQCASDEGVREVGGEVDGLVVVLDGLHVLVQFVKSKSPNELA